MQHYFSEKRVLSRDTPFPCTRVRVTMNTDRIRDLNITKKLYSNAALFFRKKVLSRDTPFPCTRVRVTMNTDRLRPTPEKRVGHRVER